MPPVTTIITTFTLTKEEHEILRMKQDIRGEFTELQRAATLVLEMVFELKADIARLDILEHYLKENRFDLEN